MPPVCTVDRALATRDSSPRPWNCIFCNWSQLGLKMYIFLTSCFGLANFFPPAPYKVCVHLWGFTFLCCHNNLQNLDLTLQIGGCNDTQTLTTTPYETVTNILLHWRNLISGRILHMHLILPFMKKVYNIIWLTVSNSPTKWKEQL